MSVHTPAMSVSSARDAHDLDRPSPLLTVRIVHEPPDEDPAVVVVVTGELDRASAPRLQSAWDAALGSFPAHVVLDLREVGNCDAAGLQALAGMSAACHARGVGLQMSTRGRLNWLLPWAGLTEDVRTQPVADRSSQDTTAAVR